MIESIADTTKPNAGRIYDYILGGHHNFEVDRQAADQLIKILPFLPKAMRLQRWCLQDLAEELTKRRGFDTIIDFASGLPTQDHIHHVAPKGTTIIYSDYDRITVEYAREILRDTPNVYFFHADARRPEDLLSSPEVQEILGDRRDVAFIHWGVAAFLADEEISHVARTLYDWAGPNSCWAFNAQGADANPDNPASAQLLKMYEKMGSPLRTRSLERFRELTLPWHPDENDFVSLLEWHGFDQTELSEADRAAVGPAGAAGYGAYLIK